MSDVGVAEDSSAGVGMVGVGVGEFGVTEVGVISALVGSVGVGGASCVVVGSQCCGKVAGAEVDEDVGRSKGFVGFLSHNFVPTGMYSGMSRASSI